MKLHVCVRVCVCVCVCVCVRACDDCGSPGTDSEEVDWLRLGLGLSIDRRQCQYVDIHSLSAACWLVRRAARCGRSLYVDR